MSKLQLITKGLIKENPTFVLILGMCPTLATTTSAMNGMGMGFATLFVLVLSNMAISAAAPYIPDKVRIPSYIVIIAAFVTILQFIMQAYTPAMYETLGLFIPLIVVNCIVLGRAEAFANKNSVIDSACDGLGIGLGFTLALTVLGLIREIIGSGSAFGFKFISGDGILVFVLAPGAFLALGYLIVLFRKLTAKKYKAMEYIIIIISAIFVNKILLSQFLGCCPFLGVSNKLSTAVGMSGAVCFVITLATLVTYLLQYYVLVPLHIEFMQTISFILVIAALVQMVEIVLKKVSPSLYQALGIFLPLITTNCAVLGVALIVVTKEFTFGGEPHMLNLAESIVYAFATSVGFGVAMVLFAGLREQLALNKVPKAFQGIPIALITASILALAFMGFSGLV